FERLVEELAQGRDLSRSPLVQVVFQMQNAPAGELAIPGLSFTPVQVGGQTAKFDLVVNVLEAAGRPLAFLVYSPALFDAATMARLADGWSPLLAGAAAAADRPLSELPLLAPAQRHQLVVEWSGSGGRPAAADCLHCLFAAQ